MAVWNREAMTYGHEELERARTAYPYYRWKKLVSVSMEKGPACSLIVESRYGHWFILASFGEDHIYHDTPESCVARLRALIDSDLRDMPKIWKNTDF